MKVVVLLLALAGGSLAQRALDVPANPVTPANPGKFTTRSIGGGSGAGIGVQEIQREPVKKVTKVVEYIAVTDQRIWTSADGREVRAAMLAYEPGPVPKEVTKPLTLVRNGKIRLFLEKRKQVTELALAKLSKDDQAFVKMQVEARRQARAFSF